MKDGYLFWREFVKAHGFTNRLTREIHEGFGFDQ